VIALVPFAVVALVGGGMYLLGELLLPLDVPDKTKTAHPSAPAADDPPKPPA